MPQASRKGEVVPSLASAMAEWDPDLLGLQLDVCHSDIHTLPSIKGLEQTKEPHKVLAVILEKWCDFGILLQE